MTAGTGQLEPPAIPADAGPGAALEALDQLARVLREHCPWDQAQTQATIVPHTIEEAFEVADAVVSEQAGALPVAERLTALEDELGDLLFQVVLLSLLSEEQDPSRTLGGVIRRIHDKLVARHPHVFEALESSTADEVRQTWEKLKRTREGRSGIFHSLPETYPATLHARKAQQRAASVGFDFHQVQQSVDKVAEEHGELVETLSSELERRGDPPGEDSEPGEDVRHEVGDLLFAVVNLARMLRVDPEHALRGCTQRFVGRVEEAARLSATEGETFGELDLERQEHWYQAAKRARGEGG